MTRSIRLMLFFVVCWMGCAQSDAVIRVKLTSPLSSSGNQPGDKVSSVVVSPENMQGDLLEGMVKEAHSGGSINKTSSLSFSFTTLYRKGEPQPIRSEIVSSTNSKGQSDVDEEGRVVKRSSNAGKVLGGAALGALVGGIAGGGKGAAIGSGSGAVVSIIVVSVAVKGPDIRFDAGSEFTVRIHPRR